MRKRLITGTGAAAMLCALTLGLAAPQASAAGNTSPHDLIKQCGKTTTSCTFDPHGKPDHFLGKSNRVTRVSYNCTESTALVSVKWSATTRESNSYGLSLAGNDGYVKAFRKAVPHWATSATVSRNELISIPSHRKAWIEYAPAKKRVNGSYVLHFHNGSHKDVKFTATGPAKDRSGKIVVHSKQLTKKEISTHCG